MTRHSMDDLIYLLYRAEHCARNNGRPYLARDLRAATDDLLESEAPRVVVDRYAAMNAAFALDPKRWAASIAAFREALT